jgi:NAD(P)-dependent dehydrogenase (short-subunit alcohol dehydrogenase family)
MSEDAGTKPATGGMGGGPPGGPMAAPALEVEEPALPALGDLFRLDGRRALVVGGYGGIGRVTTELLVEHGAAVAIAGRSLEKAASLASDLNDKGADAVAAEVDISSRDSAYALIDRAVDELGGVDILVNLAGIDLESPAEEFDEVDWQRVLEINLSGAFWLSQAAGKAMIAGGKGGRIVHFSSTRSVAGGRRGFSAYAASKGGLNMLIKQLATEWGRYRISVNGVAPGFVPTELVEHAMQDQRFTTMMLNRIPFGRFGRAEEMAAAAIFLASPGGGFVNGQVIFVDGGVTASS